MRQLLFLSLLFSLFFTSCAGPHVAIEYQGSSPIPPVDSGLHSEGEIRTSQAEDSSPFVVVQSIPQLKGGNRALRKRITYPEEAILNNAEGTVSIQFIIDESGSTSGFTVVEGIGYGCEEAVIVAIKKSRFNTDDINRNESVRHLWMVTAEFSL